MIISYLKGYLNGWCLKTTENMDMEKNPDLQDLFRRITCITLLMTSKALVISKPSPEYRETLSTLLTGVIRRVVFPGEYGTLVFTAQQNLAILDTVIEKASAHSDYDSLTIVAFGKQLKTFIDNYPPTEVTVIADWLVISMLEQYVNSTKH